MKFPIRVYLNNGFNVVYHNQNQYDSEKELNEGSIEKIDEDITLIKAPLGYHWELFSTDDQCDMGPGGFEYWDDANSHITYFPGGSYRIMLVPDGYQTNEVSRDTITFKKNLQHTQTGDLSKD